MTLLRTLALVILSTSLCVKSYEYADIKDVSIDLQSAVCTVTEASIKSAMVTIPDDVLSHFTCAISGRTLHISQTDPCAQLTHPLQLVVPYGTHLQLALRGTSWLITNGASGQVAADCNGGTLMLHDSEGVIIMPDTSCHNACAYIGGTCLMLGVEIGPEAGISVVDGKTTFFGTNRSCEEDLQDASRLQQELRKKRDMHPAKIFNLGELLKTRIEFEVPLDSKDSRRIDLKESLAQSLLNAFHYIPARDERLYLLYHLLMHAMQVRELKRQFNGEMAIEMWTPETLQQSSEGWRAMLSFSSIMQAVDRMVENLQRFAGVICDTTAFGEIAIEVSTMIADFCDDYDLELDDAAKVEKLVRLYRAFEKERKAVAVVAA